MLQAFALGALFRGGGDVVREMHGNPECNVLIADWDSFASLVEAGQYNAKAKMTADIDLGDCQAMLGDCKHEDSYTHVTDGLTASDG